jgi:hypothetical protein
MHRCRRSRGASRMPRAASAKAAGAIPALPATGGRPTPKTRRRQNLADRGPQLRLSHGEVLASLRRRCAATENRDSLRRVEEDASSLRWVVPERLRAEIDNVVARARAKRERIAAAAPPKRPRKQPARWPCAAGQSPGTTIQMIVGPWETDEHGNKSRVVWSVADGPTPPTPPVPPP